VPRDVCAGCRRPFRRDDGVLELADSNRVHLAPGYACLIAWGAHWRRAARDALAVAAELQSMGAGDVGAAE